MFRFIILFMVMALSRFSLSGQEPFPYPDVPDSLTTPEKRIEYLAVRFWDKVDFANTTVLDSSKPVLDFLYLINNARAAVVETAFSRLLELACGNQDSLDKLIYWFSHFLHDSNSPLYDDSLYAEFLKAFLSSGALEETKDGMRFPYEVVTRNQIGEVAEDFSFTDKSGELQTLHGIDSPYILLIFTNPECSLCRAAESRLGALQALRDLQQRSKLRILAICPGQDRDAWLTHDCPSGWISGYDDSGVIRDKRLYEIQYYPCFYILDSEKKVLLKEGGLEQTEKFLTSLEDENQ